MPMMIFFLRWIATAIVVLALVSTTAFVPAASQVTEADVEEARLAREEAAVERAAAIVDLDEAVVAYEAARGELEELIFSVGRLRGRIDDYQSETSVLRDEVRERAVQSYMTGDERDPIARVFAPETVQQSMIARQVLSRAVESESEQIDSLVATVAEMARLQAKLDTDSARLFDLQADADAIVGRMNDLYQAADLVFEETDQEFVKVQADRAEQVRREEEERRRQEEERRRQEEVRRQRELMQAALELPAEGVPEWVTPGFTCPVGGSSWFLDTWGAPRSGGRSHKGVDMMGPVGTPLVAVSGGIVRKSYGSLAGNIVWLYADHGVNYFYAHLDSYPGGLVDGQWVPRGQVIGYMGDSGNPRPGAYHLHFGIYPGGITAVNPYPTVEKACP